MRWKWPQGVHFSLLALLAVIVGVAVARLPLLWAVGLVGGTAVLILVFIQPLVGLALTLLLGPLGALENLILGGSSLDSGQLMLLLTLAAWLAKRLSQRQLIVPQTRLNVPFFVFLMLTLVTLLAAPSLEFGLREWLKWVEMLLVMWLVVDLAGEQGRQGVGRGVWGVILVLGMLLVAGASQAVLGVWQFGLQGSGPEHFLILGRFYRAYGTFQQPNPFGGYMNLSALLALGVVVVLLRVWWRGDWRQKIEDQQMVDNTPYPVPTQNVHSEREWSSTKAANDTKQTKYSVPFVSFVDSLAASPFGVIRHRQFILLVIFITVCGMVALVGLIASWSRGAWLGFAGGTAVLILFWPRRWWLGVGLLFIGVTLLWGGLTFNLLPASIAERITTFGEDVTFGDARGVDINDVNYAVIERLAHWQAALDMVRDHFWLGVGFGNYEPAYNQYALINWPYPLGHAHNYYLNLLAEVGVLGLLAYVGVWTAVFWQTLSFIKQHHGLLRGIALGLLAAFAALTIHHMVDKLYVNNIYIHLGAMLGLLQLLDRQSEACTLQSSG